MNLNPLRHFVMAMHFAAPLLLSSTKADEHQESSLLRPNVLVGWDYGEQQARGWGIRDGELSGAADSAPLLSGWTFGDFAVSLSWQVSEGGQVELRLPRSPDGEAIVLILSENENCGLLQDGDEVIRPAAEPFRPHGDGWHSVSISRAGGKLSVSIDEQEVNRMQADPAQRFGLGLKVENGRAKLRAIRVSEPDGESLITENLTGWWTPGNRDSWTVENGEIVCLHRRGNYLRTEKEYGNFTLEFDYKFESGSNSGIGIRTPREGWPSGDGMELQLYDVPYSRGIDKHSNMAVYGNIEPLARADRLKEWNHAVIKADGPIISAWVNGELVQHADTSRLSELQYRHLKGWIGIQDHGAKIRIRNMTVLEAPDGTGLAAWRRQQVEPAAFQVLDRLMNSRQLAESDGIQTQRLVSQIAESGENLVAELTGRGALVRLVSTDPKAALSLVVDAEEEPRYVGTLEELHAELPRVSDDANPLLTYVEFDESLKILCEDSGPAMVSVEYLSLPTAGRAEVADSDSHGIPRGMLSSLDYRHHQHDGGRHRELDPLPHAASELAVLPPGESSAPLEVPGTGITQWFKVHGSPGILDNNVWIQIFVDGEANPAITAPIRYLLPGLGEGNYHNFVVMRYKGYLNRLAMPFENGIKFQLVNRGDKELTDIGLSVTYEPKTRSDSVKTRLRGAFVQPEDNQIAFSESGRGRLVGLIADDSVEFRHLEIDGQRCGGNHEDAVKLFFGVGGGSEPQRFALSGRQGGLFWRFPLLAPIEFDREISLTGSAKAGLLVLYYLASE